MRLNPHKPGSRRHDELKHLDGQSGVYILWKKPNAYIGSTKDLRSRLRAHARIFAGWQYVYMRFPIAEARQEEIKAIRRFLAKGFKILNSFHYAAAERHPLVSRQLVYARLKMGWSLDRACKTPPKNK